jgi:hypothetical protein
MVHQSPFQNCLGFRAGNEHTRTHLQVSWAEGGSTGDVLQRNPTRAGRDHSVEPIEEAGLGRFQQSQPTALGAGHVGGQEFGIGSRGVDSGL